jgi:hypothetical protein
MGQKTTTSANICPMQSYCPEYKEEHALLMRFQNRSDFGRRANTAVQGRAQPTKRPAEFQTEMKAI